MMGLKGRLERLKAEGRGPGLPSLGSSLSRPEMLRDPAAPGALDELRERMQAILAKSEPPRSEAAVARSTAGMGELPFVERRHAEGSFWLRQETLRPSARVGRVAVQSAYDAESGMLALLALDPTLGGCDLKRALFLDTETTGLGGSGSVAFLVGLGWFTASGHLVLEQLMLPDLAGEPGLLRHLTERIAQASAVVTFNGKSFDWPLLMNRFIMNRLPEPEMPPHIDLLHIGRRLHRGRIGQCRLVTLEQHVLGYERGEDIDGSEIGPRYGHFLRTGEAEVLRAIVDHNQWDVLTMAALLGLYGELEPALDPPDTVGLAQTLRRAGALDQAAEAAERALLAGATRAALRARGQIAKARGDKASALADFEALAKEVEEPELRLELAKLYEHFVKRPDKALDVIQAGTGEKPEQAQRRRQRLLKKVEQAGSRKSRRIW